MRIRQAPSGPELTGSATGQVPRWNNTTKEWSSSTLATQVLVAGVAVPALAAAGDTTSVNIPFAGAVAGDVAWVTSTTLAADGVVISGTGLCLVPGTIGVALIATKAYAGANEDFLVTRYALV